MALWLRQSTTVNVKLGPAVSQSDAVTEKTALSPTVNLTKNAGTIAARNSATAIAHDANGWYTVELNTTDTGTLGRLQVYFRDPTSQLPVWADFMVVPAMVYDSLIAGSDYLDASVVQWTGTNVATPATAGYPAVTIKSGSGTGEVDLSSGKVLLQATQTGVTIPTVTTLTDAPSDSSGVTTLLSRLSSARAGYLDNLSAGAVALASSLTTLAGKFTGITSLAEWLGLIAGKQAGNSTARTELRATGAGSGTYDETTDSLEANRDNQMTSGELENAVLDAALSGHTTAGTAGKALSDAASAASVPTAAQIRAEMDSNSTQLAKLGTPAGASLSADLLTLINRLTSTRAGYLDNLSAGAVALNSDISTILTRLSSARAGYLDNLSAGAVAQNADIATLLTRLSSARAGYLDNINNAALATIANQTGDSYAAITGNRADPSALATSLASSLSMLAKVDWILARVMREGSFNKTTGEELIKNAAGTDIAKATAADDGTTTSRGAFGAP